jgi:hypothetical protein
MGPIKMRNWEVPVTDSLNITVRSNKKDTAKGLARKIRDLLCIYSFRRELSGIFSKDEQSTVFMTIGGKRNIPADHEAYKKECADFVNSLGGVITYPEKVYETAETLFNKHVYVDDQRKTEEQQAAEDQKYKKIHEEVEAKQNAETSAFVAKWCQPEKVDIPEGMFAIYLQITYDGSHYPSDYYAPHCSIGLPMLLGLASIQPKTERLASVFMQRHPELASLKWEWCTENYSGGWGNYLISNWTGNMVPQKSYGREEVDTRFEVRFCKRGRYKEMHPYKHYKATSLPASVSAEATATAGVTMRLNAAKAGVEIYFTGKPGEDVLASLHAAGFRHSRRRFWYAKQSERTLEFARNLTGDGSPAETPPEVLAPAVVDVPAEGTEQTVREVGYVELVEITEVVKGILSGGDIPPSPVPALANESFGLVDGAGSVTSTNAIPESLGVPHVLQQSLF